MQEIADQATTEDNQKLTKDMWHYLCSLHFLGFDEAKIKGFTYRAPSKSTRKLSVAQFTDYLGEIEAEFIGRGVSLTFPDEYNEAMGK